jgi:hypothetical protein
MWRELLYFIIRAGCVALGAILFDKIEQLPPYFECALSNCRYIFNEYRATLGTSMFLLEHCSRNILNAHRADLNTQRASSKRNQNKTDNLNDFGLEPTHKNFKNQHKIKERVKKMFSIRRHMSILLAFE